MRKALRIVLCGLVAGVIWNLLSMALLSAVAPDLIPSLKTGAPHAPLGGAFFYGVDLAMGVWSIWLYSAIASHYGARSRTAVIAGAAWWVLKTLQSAKWAGLGFIEPGHELMLLGAVSLIIAISATVAGAWLYNRTAQQ